MGNGKQSIVQRQIHNHKYFNTKNRLTQEIGRRKTNKELKQEIDQRI